MRTTPTVVDNSLFSVRAEACAGHDLRVNYYPRTTAPAPITDLSVGSVVRTLLETFAKEQAILYAQLNLAYDFAFVETATGSSLYRAVALLGYQRFRAGRPVRDCDVLAACRRGRRDHHTGRHAGH